MAQGEGGNNVAIIAIIVIALLVAGAGFLYFQGEGVEESGPSVVQRDTTVIERPVPAPQDDDPSFSFEHQDEEGNDTKIEAN